jgi:hypothetical protein
MSDSGRTELTKISVRVSGREDGGLRVTSDDVPGLLLSGADRQRVWNLVGPTVIGLLKANRGMAVEAVFYPSTSPQTGENHSVDVHVKHFVLQLRQAA